MSKLRRSGSCEVLRLPKDIDLTAVDFAGHRFRTIDTAASEEVSVGWVTPADPTGNSHEVDNMLVDDSTAWLRVRRDAKRFPAARLKLEAEAQAYSRGRPLGARERRELRDHLHAHLLPGIQPTTKMVDLLVQGRLVLLLSTSQSDREEVVSLLQKSAGQLARHLTAGELARELYPESTVQKMAPTRWPGSHHQLDITNQDWLGDEFLLWLWWRYEVDGGGIGRFGVALDDLIQFAPAGGDETSHVLRNGIPARTPEARTALRSGQTPSRLRIILADAVNSATLTLTGKTLGCSGVTHNVTEEAETAEDRNTERARAWFWISNALHELYTLFLGQRVGQAWIETTAQEINAWRQQ